MLASAKGSLGRFVRALRLLHEGDIHDPADFVSYSLIGALNTIVSNTYDRAVYSLPVRYQLSGAELSGLEGVYQALAIFDSLPPTAPASVSESLFNSSYSISIQDSRDKILLLLGSLEALVRTEYVWHLVGVALVESSDSRIPQAIPSDTKRHRAR
jgi:hypothetical protein